MVKASKRTREDADTYESDGGFVSNDDGQAPKSKKNKKGASNSDTKDSPSWEVRGPLVSNCIRIVANLNNKLSNGRNPRKVEVSEFKGARLINVREFYEKDGNLLPGKKVATCIDSARHG